MMGNMLRERESQYIATRDDGTQTWRILDTWHDVLREMNPDDEVAGKAATEWIEQQKAFWPEVDRVVMRLHEAAPVDATPEWHHQPWWMMLTLPWSDGLGQAIRDADSWCDKRENAQSS